MLGRVRGGDGWVCGRWCRAVNQSRENRLRKTDALSALTDYREYMGRMREELRPYVKDGPASIRSEVWHRVNLLIFHVHSRRSRRQHVPATRSKPTHT